MSPGKWSRNERLKQGGGMKKTPKVLPLPAPGARLIASDAESQHIIIGIGRKRIADDFFT
jgi:hypothetical protein